jgi:hypothetical protein
MKLILLILFTPRKAAEQIKASPAWLTTFLVLAAVNIAATAITHPYVVQETLAHLPSSATIADKQRVMQSLSDEITATLTFLPVRLFIGWGSFSLVLFIIARAFEPAETIRFQQVLALIIHTETVSVLAGVATVVSVLTHTNAGHTGIPFSLSPFIDSQSFIMKALFSELNVFTLWQLVIQIIGISVLCGFGRIRAMTVVVLVWVLSVFFDLGIIRLLVDRFHLLV